MSERDPRRLRNLVQYKNLTDEEFEQAMDELQKVPVANVGDFEKRVEEKMEALEQDYDLVGMKANDMDTLISLSKAFVALEDFEISLVTLREVEDATQLIFNLTMIEKLGDIISKTRKDISIMQNDLGISRKIRKSSDEDSIRDQLINLKKKAMKFYEKKMQYVYCEKCNMLLLTAWFLYPKSKNKISLVCNRHIEDSGGEVCGHITKIDSSTLLAQRGNNHKDGFDF